MAIQDAGSLQQMTVEKQPDSKPDSGVYGYAIVRSVYYQISAGGKIFADRFVLPAMNPQVDKYRNKRQWRFSCINNAKLHESFTILSMRPATPQNLSKGFINDL